MKTMILTASLLTLAGCSKGIDVQDATLDQFVAAAKDVHLQRPGRWEIKSVVSAMDLGTTDMAYQPMIRSKAMQPQTTSICVKKDQGSTLSLDRGEFMKTMACHVPHFKAGGGKLDGEVACKGQSGATTTMTEAGRYTDDTYDVHLKVAQTGPGQPKITIDTEVNARRVGDCEA